MANTPEYYSLIDKITKFAVILRSYDPESFIQTERLGLSLDFSSGKEDFETLLNLFSKLNTDVLKEIPENILVQIMGFMEQCLQIFKRIEEFEPNTNNPVEARNLLIDNIRSMYISAFPILVPIISYGSLSNNNFELDRTEVNRILEFLKERKLELEKQISSFQLDMDSTLNKVRHVAAEVGVSQHPIHFKNEAEAQISLSEKWLWAHVILILVGIGYAGICYYLLSPQSENLLNYYGFIQILIPKVMLFSVLYYAIIWSGKNYRAKQHNYIVNKHRQNALSSFEAFVKATDNDSQTKNAVLLQATQAIFSPQPSGYASHDNENSSSTQVLEIFRGIPQK